MAILIWKGNCFFMIADPPVDVYNGGLLRSLRSSAPASSVGVYDSGLLRSLIRSAPGPASPYEEGLLRSLRSGANNDIHVNALLRSVRSGPIGDPYERGLLRSLRSAPTAYLKLGKSPQVDDDGEIGLVKYLSQEKMGNEKGKVRLV